MRESEVREHAKCSHCGKGIGHTHLPLFWTVTAKRWGLDAQAMQRSQGMTMFLGSAALAMAMGIDEEMASEMESRDITLCEHCALPLMAILEGCKQDEPAAPDEPEEDEEPEEAELTPDQ